MTSKKFLQSHVYSEHGEFFVSTCYRRSSARLNPDEWYYETFAWEWEENKRTDWIADNSGASSKDRAYDQHIEVCKQLERTGKFTEEEQDTSVFI